MDTDEDATPIPLNLTDPVELIAFLPFRFGFHPANSAAFLALRHHELGSLEVGLAARVDLADTAGGSGAEVRRDLLRNLEIDGAAEVFAVIYTDTPFAEVLSGTSPAARTLRWWRSTRWGDDTRTWLVSATAMRCVECADEPCCPQVGRPIEEVNSAKIVTELVYRGFVVAPNRSALVPTLEAPETRRRPAIQAAVRERRRRDGLRGAELALWRHEMLGRWRRAVSAAGWDVDPRAPLAGEALNDLPAGELGALLAGLDDARVRDAILLSAVSGTRIVDPADESGAEVLRQVFEPGQMRPDRLVLSAATRTLFALAALAGHHAATPLAMGAWLSWWGGDGARADLLAERSLDLEPTNKLAMLVAQALSHAMPPGWARANESA